LRRISAVGPLQRAMRRPFLAFLWAPKSMLRPPGARSTVQDAPPILLARPHSRQRSEGYGATPRRAVASCKRGGLHLAGALRRRSHHPCRNALGAAAHCASPRTTPPVRIGTRRRVRALIGHSSSSVPITTRQTRHPAAHPGRMLQAALSDTAPSNPGASLAGDCESGAHERHAARLGRSVARCA
jgi:hypothetical protein